MSHILAPLWLSLQIAVTATVLAALAALPLAFVMARRRFYGKSLIEALAMAPLVLPPTVVGYLIITTLGAQGWVGQWLHQTFGYSLIFRFEGAVLAAAIVALPMVYMPSKAGFASVDRELEDIARLMGANRLQMLWHVSLPLAWRGIAAGGVLAFARALGEFGATLMVFGWQPGRITLPISIYSDYEQGNLRHATAAVLALSAASLALIILYNRSAASRQEQR